MTDLDTWRPLVEEAEDTVSANTVAALHNLLDSHGPAPRSGEPIPPLWHWLAFLPRVPQRDLGVDGHPKLGTFMPPVPPSRRMFAGGQLTFHAPLIVGQLIRRTSTVTSVEQKTGRSGTLIFVKVIHDYRVAGDNGMPAVHEQQDIVYRPITPAPPSDPPAETGPPGAAADLDQPVPNAPWQWDLPITPTLLFRFSALTYNAHRIHYDRQYATHDEGYPGLVVHGPLQAIALAELARRERPRHPVSSFQFKTIHPAYDEGVLHLRGEPAGDEGSLALTAYSAHGQATTQAHALLREPEMR